MMLRPIISSIENLNQIHEELLALSTKKRDALIKSDLEQLVSINQEESNLLKQVDQKEKERTERIDAFLQAKGRQQQEITLMELIEIITDPKEKQELTDKAYTLQRTLRELQELNQFNTTLIADSMQFIQYSLDLFTDQATDHVNYQRPASQPVKGAVGSRRSIFDTKA